MPPAAVAWSVALVAVALLAAGAAWVWVDRRRRSIPAQMPSDWAVQPRLIFNTDERRLRRQLVEAFPNHVVVTKLQLIRFCQPDNPREMRYWYDLLSPLYVSFAICADNGRVLAAIDIDLSREGLESRGSRRAAKIKQAVFEACRVRYARSPSGQLPTVAELRSLLPEGFVAPASRPASAAGSTGSLNEARHQLAHTVAARRRERARSDTARDANDFQDSFFSTDVRADPVGPSGFDILSPAPSNPPEKTDHLPVLRMEVTLR